MSEAMLVEWLVEDGAIVSQGTPLYMLEMEKSNNEIESPAAGTVKIIGQVGEIYQVGDVIATIG